METEEFEQQMYDEMQDSGMEQLEDQEDDRLQSQYDFQSTYGSPEPKEQFNQHSFLSNSLMFDQPEKVTFMTESELGRPLFSLRFLLDIEDIAKYYLDDIALDLGIYNKIALYFREKITNYCSSGMSNKGFVQNLNVTKKMDTVRQRIRNLPEVKGGKQIRR